MTERISARQYQALLASGRSGRSLSPAEIDGMLCPPAPTPPPAPSLKYHPDPIHLDARVWTPANEELLLAALSRWHLPHHKQDQHGGFRTGTEQRFYNEFIRPRIATREFGWWAYEPVALRIGVDSEYTPDFWTGPDVHVWEVKGGYQWKAGRVKAKVAAGLWHWPLTLMAWKERKWTTEPLNAVDETLQR